jgi:hypothetical protein
MMGVRNIQCLMHEKVDILLEIVDAACVGIDRMMT